MAVMAVEVCRLTSDSTSRFRFLKKSKKPKAKRKTIQIMTEFTPKEELVNEADHNYSVDELFSQVQISDIRKINHEYKQKASQAKRDLHYLVGLKYRDLIKIAEEIDEMYAINHNLYENLSNLSYGRTSFVTEEKDSFIAMQEKRRKREAEVTRLKEKKSILNRILNGVMLKFHITFMRAREIPIKRTSHLVFFARLCYTIEVVFEDILKLDNFTRNRFYQYREEFIRYLDMEISQYNLTTYLLFSSDNDIFKFGQRVSSNDIMLNEDLIESYWRYEQYDEENEDFDFETEDKNTLDEGHFSSNEFKSSLENSNARSYSPIINYVAAYVILGIKVPVGDTVPLTYQRFVDVRYNFMKTILDSIRSRESPRFDVFQIIKFIENTFDYTNTYFKGDSSDLKKLMKMLSGPWKAGELLGFTDFLENENAISFNFLELESRLDFNDNAEQRNLKAYVDLLFGSLFSLLDDSASQNFDCVDIALSVFSNVILSLKRLEKLCQLNNRDSRVTRFLSKDNILSEVLSRIIKVAQKYLNNQFLELNSRNDGSILVLIEERLKDEAAGTGFLPQILLSSDHLDMMDKNLDQYIDLTSKSSSLINKGEIENKLNSWFDIFIKFYGLIDVTEKSALAKSPTSLERVLKIVSGNDFVFQWGKFSRESILNSFSNLVIETTELLWKNLHSLVQQLRFDNLKQSSNSTLYFSLHLVVLLKKRCLSLKFVNHSKVTEELLRSLDNIVKHIYGFIIEKIGVGTLNNTFESMTALNILPRNDVYDQISRPSLRLSAGMSKVASKFISPENIKSNYGFLFIDAAVNSSFIDKKNEWVRKLIDTMLITSERELEEVVNTKDSIYITFANVVFLDQFCSKKSTSTEEHYIEIKRKISKIYGEDLEESLAKNIFKGVSDFYLSSKHMYLPLSIN